jgi:hypothetical protein
MASTYSTNLRTELIGTGDQAGTWGNTTNTTLGSILEQAVAGVSGGPYISGTYPAVNFPTDADITLTANNGSVDQARSAVLVVTSSGSLTATRNVIAPASASKVYIIKNSTTGGQSIQIKYATGTGVTVTNGNSMIIYGDGTNFYNAETIIANATNATNLLSGGTIASSVTATTQTAGDNSTKVATTAYVATAVAASPVSIPSGSVTNFYQSAAPTGWTQVTAMNDYAMRIVSGVGGTTGGTTAFSTVFANQTPTITTSGLSVGATTLSTSQIPSHSHTIVLNGGSTCGAGTGVQYISNATSTYSGNTDAQGGGGSHTHSLSGSATSSAITLNVLYQNHILCTKN